MPLDSRKLTHLQARLALIRQNRTQQITLICKNSDGTTTALAVPAIWRAIADTDPTTLMHPAGAQDADVMASFLAADVSLATLRACIYAYPTTLGSNEIANRYLLISIEAKGMPPGGDRFVCLFERQR